MFFSWQTSRIGLPPSTSLSVRIFSSVVCRFPFIAWAFLSGPDSHSRWLSLARSGQLQPQLIRKGQRRSDAFDRRIISPYARGMTVRETQGFLRDQHGLEVPPDFISAATEGVMDEVTAWQNRPLETPYPIVVFDALRVKIL